MIPNVSSMNKYRSKKTGRVVVMANTADQVEIPDSDACKGGDTFIRDDRRIIVPGAELAKPVPATPVAAPKK